MAINWFRSVGFCLWIFTWCYCSAPVFIKQQAVCLDAGVKHDFALSPPPVVQQSFQCLWAVKCTHAAEVLETPDLSGIMLTDPLSRFPQSLLSHKEQCHVAKFMRSAFCLLFLACQKALLQTPSRTNLFALTQTRPSAKQDPPNTLALSTLLVCISVLSKPAHQGEQPACGIITDCYAMMQNRPAWSMPITLHVISYQNLSWIHLSDLEQQAN